MRTYKQIAGPWTLNDMFVCSECGAVVKEQHQHEKFHAALVAAIDTAGMGLPALFGKGI